MYAAIRRWKVDEQRTEEATRKLEETFVPRLEKMEGFVAYYVVDDGEGNSATVSVFRDRRTAEESTQAARSFAQEELEGFIRGGPDVLEGDIVVQASKAT